MEYQLHRHGFWGGTSFRVMEGETNDKGSTQVGRCPDGPLSFSIVPTRRFVAGRVFERNAIGIPIRGVAAAIHMGDGRSNPLLELLDLEAILVLFFAWFHDVTSWKLVLW
jgi:hypothetical protein